MAANTCKVCFDPPICVEIDAPARPGRPLDMPYQDKLSLIAHLKNGGWDDRAVVTLRSHQRYTVLTPISWGVVIDMNRVSPLGQEPYKPIKVKWCRDGKTTDHWPEELYLLHKPLTVWDIDEVMEE